MRFAMHSRVGQTIIINGFYSLLESMNEWRGSRHASTRAMARGSLVIVLLIVVSIVLLSGYGTYKYIPQVHSEVHSIIHPAPTTTTFASFPTVSVQSTRLTTVTITQPLIVSTQGGTTLFYANSSQTTESATPSSTTSFTSVASAQNVTETTQSVSSQNQIFPFVLDVPPSVYLSQGQPYLNVSYTNTLNTNLSVYEQVTLSSSNGVQQVGTPLLTIGANRQMGLSIQLGNNLPPGDYLVTFYVVNSSTGQQASQSESIHFRL